ncbi:hypothetical protein VNO78_10085 [Psophocarpus tetragonolobus]|uniref:Uncharacterized protein n=1 Tax=Psophocarpus tetragonolobus TaxID=3891 RepID=A0AAN9SK30_PSOTE
MGVSSLTNLDGKIQITVNERLTIVHVNNNASEELIVNSNGRDTAKPLSELWGMNDVVEVPAPQTPIVTIFKFGSVSGSNDKSREKLESEGTVLESLNLAQGLQDMDLLFHIHDGNHVWNFKERTQSRE